MQKNKICAVGWRMKCRNPSGKIQNGIDKAAAKNYNKAIL